MAEASPRPSPEGKGDFNDDDDDDFDKGLSVAMQLFKRPSDCLSATTWLFKVLTEQRDTKTRSVLTMTFRGPIKGL